MVLNIIFICRHHYVCKTSLHLLSAVCTTDQIHSAFLSLVSFSKSKVVAERSSNLFTITLLKKIMEILIKVHLNYFKTCCGKDSSETTERKNFYLYQNCITFFSTYQHKTVIFVILINMKKTDQNSCFRHIQTKTAWNCLCILYLKTILNLTELLFIFCWKKVSYFRWKAVYQQTLSWEMNLYEIFESICEV